MSSGTDSAGVESDKHLDLLNRNYSGDVLRFCRAHPGLAVPAGLFAILLVNIFGAARGQTQTALELAKALGSPKSAFGLVYSLVPILWTLTIVGLLLYGVQHVKWDRRRSELAVVRSVQLLLVGSLFIAWDLVLYTGILVFVAVAGMVSYTRIRRRRGKYGPPKRPNVGALLRDWVLPVGLLLLVASRATTWVPSERVVTRGGEAYVGYVLNEDGAGFTTIMLDADRSVLKLRSDDVLTREQCRLGARQKEPLPILLILKDQDRAKLPPCR